jgi:UDP-N-acetylmuramate dehydrogenase
MILQEHVPLNEHTTLKIGGPSRFYSACRNQEDVLKALSHARTHKLPFYVLGEGSNVLASDAGYEGIIIHYGGSTISYQEEGDVVIVTAEAGVSWDALVEATVEQGLWGLENLAGIPGTVGASPVQNIGAYGAELSDLVFRVSGMHAETGEPFHLSKDECEFGYRESRFKKEPNLIITSVTFLLRKEGASRVSYPDLAKLAAEGVSLETPQEIARAVRAVRAQKFPDLKVFGTAGSFFKNPILQEDVYESLKKKYPELPGFTTSAGIKVPLAWILDHVLSMRGFRIGPVRLFERQPIVLVTEEGAEARDVDVLVEEVTRRVCEATNITIEREVRSLV